MADRLRISLWLVTFPLPRSLQHPARRMKEP